MQLKTFQKDDAYSEALYSECLTYRYKLTRRWEESGKGITFIMLNPSTATEVQNDPTVERCERRARALGFGAFCVTNIFAFRETDPYKMRQHHDPIGPENDAQINEACLWADKIVAAWGTHGAHLKRGAMVQANLKQIGEPIFHLGLTKAGHPKHPLYISYQQIPTLWTEI